MVDVTPSVLIVGAGPVGLFLACELARRQVPFRIIERAAGPAQGSRAKALQPRSLELLNDLGIAEGLMAKGSTDLPFRKFAGGKALGVTPRSVFPRVDTRYPKTLLLPQWMVEDALRAKLADLGGHLEWSTEMVEIVENAGTGITCRLATERGIEEANCTWLVACDGGKGGTRKKLGISFVGETHADEVLWVGDVEVAGLPPDAWYNWMSPKYGIAFALFPFAGTPTWQVQAVMPPAPDGQVPVPTLDGFNALFRERTGMTGVTFTRSTWQSVYRVNVRRADRYRVGNAFIAGDAAHVHSIAGGMGMNTGLQDACNLAWKLAAVARGDAAGRLLDTYAEERIPIADWLLATTNERQHATLAAAVAGTGSMDKIATRETTQLDLHYRGSSLSAAGEEGSARVQAGDRAPDVQLKAGWLSDRLRGPRWKVLDFAGAAPPRRMQVDFIAADDPALAEAYGMNDGLVLIRPDGHIALIAHGTASIDAYFDRLAGAG